MELNSLLDFLIATRSESLRQELLRRDNRARVAGRFIASISMELTILALPIKDIKVLGVLIARLMLVLGEFVPNHDATENDPINIMFRAVNKLMCMMNSEHICVEGDHPRFQCDNDTSSHCLGFMCCRSVGCTLITNCRHLLDRHADSCPDSYSLAVFKPYSITLQQALPYLTENEITICGTSNDIFPKALQGFAQATHLWQSVYSTRPLVITVESDEDNAEQNNMDETNGVDGNQATTDHETIPEARASSADDTENQHLERRSHIIRHKIELLRIELTSPQDPYRISGPLRKEYFRQRSKLRMLLTDKENNYEYQENCLVCQDSVIPIIASDDERDPIKYLPVLVQCEQKCPTSLLHLSCILRYSTHALSDLSQGKISLPECLRCCLKGNMITTAIQLISKHELESMLLHMDPHIICLFCRQENPANHLLGCARTTFKKDIIDKMDLPGFARSLRSFLGIYDERSCAYLQLPERTQRDRRKCIKLTIAKRKLVFELEEAKDTLTISGLTYLIKGHGLAANLLLETSIRRNWNEEFKAIILKIEEWSHVYDHKHCKLGSCVGNLSNPIFHFLSTIHEAILLFLKPNEDLPITRCIRTQRQLRSDLTCSACDISFGNPWDANAHFHQDSKKNSINQWLYAFEQLIYRNLNGTKEGHQRSVLEFYEADQDTLDMILCTAQKTLMNMEVTSRGHRTKNDKELHL